MQKIYLISSDNGYVKIGIAENPEKRLKQLQTGNANKLTLEYIAEPEYNKPLLIEKMIHKNLKSHKKQGEWFDISVETAKLEIIFALCRYDGESFNQYHVKANLFF